MFCQSSVALFALQSSAVAPALSHLIVVFCSSLDAGTTATYASTPPSPLQVVDCCLPSPPEEDHRLPRGVEGWHEDIEARR